MGARLSPLDNAFLQVEDAENRMQLAGMLLFDGEAPDFEEFRHVVGERLLGLPHFTQRLSGSLLGLARPRWVADPAFDLNYHVTRVALPAPGGHDEISAHIENLTSSPLDLRRPLWEIGLVEGLEGFAISLKIHHCMVDGLSIIDVFTALLAPDSNVPAIPPRPAKTPAPVKSTPFKKLIPAPVAGVVGVAGMLGQAPSSLFNGGSSGPTRRVSYVTVPLDDIHEIRHAYGTTVNNVVLAIVSGGLRRYLMRHDAAVDKLHAFVPVNARPTNGRGAMGNQIAMTYPELPVGVAEPDERMARVIASVRRTATSGQAAMTSSLMGLLSHVPAPIAATLNRAMQFQSGMFNVTVTNVPGPPVPLHFLGRQLELIVGSTPLTRQHGLTVAVLTYNGMLTFMTTSDPRRVPDGESIADDLQAEFDELSALVQRNQGVRHG
jgi:WS/DGAT/MGAT family acyltransferase